MPKSKKSKRPKKSKKAMEAPKSMKQITKFYLECKEPPGGPHWNENIGMLERLIQAIDKASPAGAAQAAIDTITRDFGAPDGTAEDTLRVIIDSDLTNRSSRFSALEILKHICMAEGGDAGKRRSVNPPNPWQT